MKKDRWSPTMDWTDEIPRTDGWIHTILSTMDGWIQKQWDRSIRNKNVYGLAVPKQAAAPLTALPKSVTIPNSITPLKVVLQVRTSTPRTHHPIPTPRSTVKVPRAYLLPTSSCAHDLQLNFPSGSRVIRIIVALCLLS